MLDNLDHAMTAALRAENFDEFVRLAALAEIAHTEREERLRAPGALAAAAMFYAGRGIAVFPLHPGDKRPYPGTRGFKDATTSTDIVRAWWRNKPTSNIGVPTGHGFDVIDVDGPAGYQSLADLRETGKLPPVLARAFTPRGGMHLYVPATGSGNAASFLPGLDYRGIGGYVVAPPSVGANTRRYDWIEPLPVLATGAVAA